MSDVQADEPVFIPKQRIAEIQLERALKLFLYERDYVSAITLAGAAEEIFGKLLILEGKGDRVSKDNWIDLCILAGGFDDTKAHRREFAGMLNWHRNELKHHDARPGEELVEEMLVGRSDAVDYLGRAVDNYLALTGNYSDDLIVRFHVDADEG